MRRNIASFLENTSLGMEGLDADQQEVYSQNQLQSVMDDNVITADIQSIQESQVALEKIHETLLALKFAGKGLSLEGAQFAQIYLDDVDNKLGIVNRKISLESYGDDHQRLDVALEGIGNKISALIMSNFTGVGWIVLKILKHLDSSEAKNIHLKNSLESAIIQYEQNGKTQAESVSGSFGAALLKDHTTNPANSVVIANVKQYVGKIDDPIKERAIEKVLDAGTGIIKMIRSNWFFTSSKENEELKSILEELKTAITEYAQTEEGIIGQGKYKIEFDDEGEPSLKKNVTKQHDANTTFKPLDEKEFAELSKELIRLADININIGKKMAKILEKTKSTYGWSFANGVFRLGPTITSMVATVAATAVAGPVAGAATSKLLNTIRVPSRDIYQAMRYAGFVSTLQQLMMHDSMQRAKVLAEGTLLIRKSTA